MRALVVVAVTLLLLVPVVPAVPSTSPGIPNACEKSPPGQPCKHLPPPPPPPDDPNTVEDGETEQYVNGTFDNNGTIHILAGGTVIIDNATMNFENASGFVAEGGGTLIVKSSTLQSSNDAPFLLDARLDSTILLQNTRVDGGLGVHVATNNATITGNLLTGIEVALRLDGATITVHNNTFSGNLVGVNMTGGVPTLADNLFVNNYWCVRDYRTDPTIVRNTFRACIFGIWHEESESYIAWNDLSEDGEPISEGITVIGGHSPVLEGNVITNFNKGIVIRDARAYIRNNTIHNNTGIGILVERNVDAMDVQGNLVVDNGGEGIVLRDARDLQAFNNVVARNGLLVGAAGIRASGGTAVTVSGNTVQTQAVGIVCDGCTSTTFLANGVSTVATDGIQATGTTAGVLFDGNVVTGSGRHGILVESAGVALARNVATGNAMNGIVVRANGVTLQGDAADDNVENGILIEDAIGVSLVGTQANRNFVGVQVTRGGDHTITGANASENERAGFVVDTQGSLRPVALDHVRAIGNGLIGVLNEDGSITATLFGWYEGHIRAGVANLDLTRSVDARFSYWGSPRGPIAADNIGGDGDPIVGLVEYKPFATSPP